MVLDYRPIENFPGYIISNYGIVYSIRFDKVREMKSSIKPSGYKELDISSKTVSIHSLVGNAFIGKREDGLTYDHIDRNRLNNRADNLRLATKSEQQINKNMMNNNTSGEKNISSTTTRGKAYWRIVIKRNKKAVFQKWLNKKKFNIEDAVRIRDEFINALD